MARAGDRARPSPGSQRPSRKARIHGLRHFDRSTRASLKPVDHIDTASNWRERRRILLKSARVYDRLDELIAGAKANQMSLAVFKPISSDSGCPDAMRRRGRRAGTD